MLHINAVKPIDASLGLSFEIDSDNSDPLAGFFTLVVDLTHPFGGSMNLTGFDVRGILITTAEYTSGDLPLPGENDPVLLNADGYTRWWNPTEFPVPGLLGYTPGLFGKDPQPGQVIASGINPYMQFADGLYYSYPVSHLKLIMPTGENGRGVFRAGETNSREYQIQFPVDGFPKVSFNYAIDASWDAPDNDPPSIPNDFPMEANAQEAWLVDTVVASNSLWGVGGSPQSGGELELEIEVWDWQGWLQGYEDQFGPMVLISPLCNFDEDITPSWDENGTGGANLTVTVPGKPIEAGLIPVWVGVSAPGTTYKQTAVPAPDEIVAAFDLIWVEVTEAECTDNGNNDCTSAEDIASEDTKEGLLCLGVDEADWFTFNVPEYGSAEGTIHLATYSVGDLNLLLYKDCPPTLVDYSSNPGALDEEIVLDGLGFGEYYIQALFIDDGDDGPRPYTLTTSITGLGEECTQDDNNSSDDAEGVALDESVEETVCLIGDQVDWFTFSISEDTSGSGTITLFNDDYANNDIEVYDDTLSTPLYTGNNPGTDDEIIEITVIEPGDYFIRIEAMGDEPSGDRPITLEMDLEEVSGDCDNSDGNNKWEDAIQTSLVGTEIGTACFPTDPDWFMIDVPATGVTGTINLSSSVYDNDLALFGDPTEAPIMESANPGSDDEQLVIDELTDGIYYIRITAASDPGGQNQEYILTTELVPIEASPTDIFIHAHIVRTNEGSNPATTDENVENHVAWANEFFGIYYGGAAILAEISYIDKTAWQSLTVDEAELMFGQYGTSDGALNVFYVNSTPDMPGAAAYAWMECQFILQDHTSGYVIMTDYADDPTLAHEMGHAVGLLADMYLLDFYTCDQITYCESGPTDIYCEESDAVYGNIMYWPVGTDIEDYFASTDDIEMTTGDIDSQAENIMYFHVNYPDAFYSP